MEESLGVGLQQRDCSGLFCVYGTCFSIPLERMSLPVKLSTICCHACLTQTSSLQELENYAASKKGPAVWRMQPWFQRPEVLRGNERFAQLLAELLSIGAVTGLKPGVTDLVVKLDALMLEGNVPPVAILRHPRVHTEALEV